MWKALLIRRLSNGVLVEPQSWVEGESPSPFVLIDADLQQHENLFRNLVTYESALAAVTDQERVKKKKAVEKEEAL